MSTQRYSKLIDFRVLIFQTKYDIWKLNAYQAFTHIHTLSRLNTHNSQTLKTERKIVRSIQKHWGPVWQQTNQACYHHIHIWQMKRSNRITAKAAEPLLHLHCWQMGRWYSKVYDIWWKRHAIHWHTVWMCVCVNVNHNNNNNSLKMNFTTKDSTAIDNWRFKLKSNFCFGSEDSFNFFEALKFELFSNVEIVYSVRWLWYLFQMNAPTELISMFDVRCSAFDVDLIQNNNNNNIEMSSIRHI